MMHHAIVLSPVETALRFPLPPKGAGCAARHCLIPRGNRPEHDAFIASAKQKRCAYDIRDAARHVSTNYYPLI